MADYIATMEELTAVANAIRAKGGTSEQLVFPEGFVSAISALETGGGGGGSGLLPAADFVQAVAAISLRSRLTLGTLSDHVSTTEIRQKKTIDTTEWEFADRYVEITGSNIMARVEWEYESSEQTIDSGRMTVVKAVTNDLTSVEAVTVDG